MKKLFTCIIAATGFLAANGYAQVEDARGLVSVGLKAGMNGSNIYDSYGDNFQATSKLGLAAGVFATLPVTRTFGIQPEVMISQKGFLGSGRGAGMAYAFARTSTFLDVPVLLQFNANDFVSILVGPQFSYLLSQKDEYRTSNGAIMSESQMYQNDPRRAVLGLSTGVDLNFSHIVVGARGAFDFVNNNGDGTATEPRYKNAFLQLTVGYRFY